MIEKIKNACIKAMQTEEFKRGDSIRLFHGRGGCYEDLTWVNIDFFDPIVVIVIYQKVEQDWLRELSAMLMTTISSQENTLSAVLVQMRYEQQSPFEILTGQLPSSVFATREKLQFKLSFNQQNLGYFLDIEPARLWLKANCKGKRVLNLFSYTCAFSVIAKSAGASAIVNIDLSRRSLNIGRENHTLNQLPVEDVSFFAHDIFKSWGKLKKYGPYDIVVLDPPSFQKGSFVAKKDYHKILRRLDSLTEEGGYALVCLNDPSVEKSFFRTLCSQILEGFTFIQALPASVFVPEADSEKGLKLNLFQKKSD